MLWWLLRQLKSKNARTRIDAAEKLGKQKDPRAVKALTTVALGDLESKVQTAAVKALGEIGDPGAVSTLLFLFVKYEPHGEVAPIAKEAILQIGPAAVSILTHETSNPDSQFRIGAQHLIKTIERHDRVGSGHQLAETKPKGKDPGQTAERLAMDLLFRLQSYHSTGTLKDRKMLKYAITALQQFRKLPADRVTTHVEVIAKALDSKFDPIRQEALETLVYVLGEESQPQLLSAFRDPSYDVRYTACRLLSEFRNAAPVKQIVDFLNDHNDYVRESAARTLRLLGREALAKFSDLAPIDHLIKRLADDCSKVRESAAYALGELGAAKAIPTLKQLLQDPSATSEPWQTRFGARLEDWGEETVYPVREAASWALSKIDEKMQD